MFWKVSNWTHIYKNNLNCFNILGSKFGFREPFMMGKKGPLLSVTRFFPFWNLVLAQKYQPFWVSVSVLDLNQTSGFGCALLHSIHTYLVHMLLLNISSVIFAKISTCLTWGNSYKVILTQRYKSLSCLYTNCHMCIQKKLKKRKREPNFKIE